MKSPADRRPAFLRPFAVLLCLLALLALLALLGLHSNSAAAQSQASSPPDVAPPPTFDDRQEVLVIEIPVLVTSHGKPVTTLKAEDFRLLFEGEEQPIEFFEAPPLALRGTELGARRGASNLEDGTTLHFASPATAYRSQVNAPSPAPGRRSLVVLFDLAYSPGPQLAEGLQTAAQMLESLQPGDRFGVAIFSATQFFQPILQPDDDRETGRRALAITAAVLGNDAETLDRLLPTYRLMAPSVDAEALRAETGTRIRGDRFWPHLLLLDKLTTGLEEFLTVDEQNPDRSLFYLSTGLPDRYFALGNIERADMMRRRDDLVRLLVERRWKLHAINTGGLGFGREILLSLAHDSGGTLHTNSNDVGLLLREAETVTHASYRLGFTASPALAAAIREKPSSKVRIKLVGGPAKARVHYPSRWRWGQAGEGSAEDSEPNESNGMNSTGTSG